VVQDSLKEAKKGLKVSAILVNISDNGGPGRSISEVQVGLTGVQDNQREVYDDLR